MKETKDGTMSQFIADVSALYQAGAVTLPRAADYFGKAASAIHKTGESDVELFKPVGDGSGTAKLLVEWTSLRNDIQDRVLVPTRDSLVKAGEALCEVAQDIAETDARNGQALKDAFNDIDTDPSTANRPPAHVTEAPSSGDPHPQDDSADQPPGRRSR